MMLRISISDVAFERLHKISQEDGRSVTRLAEDAVEEAALEAFRNRKDDPAVCRQRAVEGNT